MPVNADASGIDRLLAAEPGKSIKRVVDPRGRVDPPPLAFALAIAGIVEAKRGEAFSGKAGGHLRQHEVLHAGQALAQQHRRAAQGTRPLRQIEYASELHAIAVEETDFGLRHYAARSILARPPI